VKKRFYKYKNIKDIPQELKPREKLSKMGAQALSDEELLAVILGTGTKDFDVLSLSSKLTEIGWKKLEEMSLSELTAVKGVGKVKALQIKALIELSRRIREPFAHISVLTPESAYEFLKDKFNSKRESLIALYLDLSHRVMEMETIAIGSLNRVFAEPKEILRTALVISAYGILVAHNHPQGNAEPSQEDIAFTQRLKKACSIMGFELVDHIILSKDSYTSLRERNLI